LLRGVGEIGRCAKGFKISYEARGHHRSEWITRFEYLTFENLGASGLNKVPTFAEVPICLHTSNGDAAQLTAKLRLEIKILPPVERHRVV
jgi:hypothetical protein